MEVKAGKPRPAPGHSSEESEIQPTYSKRNSLCTFPVSVLLAIVLKALITLKDVKHTKVQNHHHLRNDTIQDTDSNVVTLSWWFSFWLDSHLGCF